MGSPAVLDLDLLLAPIVGADGIAADDASRCGVDPRGDISTKSPYLAIKDARQAAVESERAADRGFGDDGEARRAEVAGRQGWQQVQTLGTKLLGATAKDLEVAAWLTEASLRLHGLAGVRDGMRLLAGLVDRFWDGLFPIPDEDGIKTRVLPIAGLSGSSSSWGRLIQPLRKLPLTESDDGSTLALWEFEKAIEAPAGKLAPGTITLDSFRDGLKRSAPERVGNLIQDGEAAIEVIAELGAALDTRCGSDAPSLTRLRETLEEIVRAVRGHAPASVLDGADAPPPAAALPAAAAAPAEPEAAIAVAPASAAPARTNGHAPHPVLDRLGAFRQLEELAAFFRRTEPHSPMAYAIENLVRRGRMTLPELIEELIVDGTARRDYFISAGIRPPPDAVKAEPAKAEPPKK